MESPAIALSRSPSASPFAPGRRSHPNLQHISLAPLTPKYPIDPADYSAYFDPETSELHTSASLSHISGLPSPGGILTNSPTRSRANSRTRLKKKTRSHVSINLPPNAEAPPLGPSTPSGALTSHGFGHATLRPANSHTKFTSRPHLSINDPSWLVQTGLTLTASSRENKGQSWLAQRDSSISLASLYTANEEQPHQSGHTTPNPSRPVSRAASRANSRAPSRASSRTRHSRKDLAMTPAGMSQLQKALTEEEVQPDWADKETQAEIAARVVSEMSDELDDGDPFGMLNFEDQVELELDTEDEEEVRKELAKNKMGSWLDGVVDVFLKLEEEYPEPDYDPDLEKGESLKSVQPVTTEPETTKMAYESVWDEEVEAPPEQPRGLWDDVKWFGRMLARTVHS